MPKYYIQDDVQGWIIDGKDPFSACVKGIYFKMINSFQLNAKTKQIDEVISYQKLVLMTQRVKLFLLKR